MQIRGTKKTECKIKLAYGQKISLKGPLHFERGARHTKVSLESEEG